MWMLEAFLAHDSFIVSLVLWVLIVFAGRGIAYL
jgi:hypothetical protein